jgi:hypothetical protein
MTNLAACAVMFLRGDVRPAIETIPRSYSAEQVRESIRLPYSERTYFTPGFNLSLPLRHAMRIAGFAGQSGQYPEVTVDNPIVSDTGELCWYRSERGKGLVTIETEKSQAIIGFIKDNNKTLKNISVTAENEFCSIIVTSLNEEPISGTQSLLLVATARSANQDMTWNEDRTSLSDWGSAPTVIEPVRANVTVRNIKPAENAEAIPLDGAGKRIGRSIRARMLDNGFEIPIGEVATPWYLVRIRR